MELLPPPLAKALSESQATGKALDKKTADGIAEVLHTWATERGAVSYSHFFQPLRDGPAEKHDSFLRFSNGELTPGFSGSMMLQGETDGSSFPNGGLRGTHHAGAHTVWDTSSPPWVREGTLYLPSAFVTYDGVPLDEKTPLLRSMQAVEDASLRLLRALGDTESESVDCEVGWEQEFFVLDRELVVQRPDIQASGRTVLGAAPSRGQQTDANYFGMVPPRVKAMLRDAQAQMWDLGISCVTLHNEVAPGQHETAPVFGVTNVAADENVLMMQILKDTGIEHGLSVLYHEKPMQGLNGSGKHNNWSLTARSPNSAYNLSHPGSSPEAQAAFIAFTTALLHGVAFHGDLLRAGVATAGNDFRLGAQEAPPAVMSAYLGTGLTSHLESVIAGGELAGYSAEGSKMLSLGARSIPAFQTGLEDRNRTAPVPFIGNRFEWRSVGSAQNISTPLTYLHAAVADGINAITSKVEAGDSVRDAVAAVAQDSIHAVFNGDAYSDEWGEEAARRGLPNTPSSCQAIKALADSKNATLLADLNILEKEALAARHDLSMEGYAAQVELEATAMLKMLQQGYIPAASSDSSIAATPIYADLENTTSDLADALASTRKIMDTADATTAAEAASALKTTMAATRAAADAAELVIPASQFPFPNYEELLFNHHSTPAYSNLTI